MPIVRINPETGLAGIAVDHAVATDDGRPGSVAAPNRLLYDLLDPAAPGTNPGAHNRPVQIYGDISQLADLCLAPSYSAFARGDSENGCRKLWEAAEFALSAVAEKRGWPCQTEDDHFNLLTQLQSETGKYEDPDIVAGYLVACNYRDNVEYGFMEDYAIRGGLPVVHNFVRELLSLA